ncbi:MAG TPA: hypothetical protein VMO47_16610 [Rhodothermales bacterium]|nr:hypothetical protein [Rhodothermales bacterium]
MFQLPAWQRELRFLGGSRDAEQARIDRFETEIRAVARTYGVENGMIMRAEHAKMLAGFGTAVFRISQTLPEDLEVDFLIPGNAYPAEIRFSNASSLVAESDAEPDLRGAAVRVVVGKSIYMDFLLTNANRHHARDAEEAMATTVAFAITGPLRTLRGALRLIRRVGLSDGLRIVRTLKSQMAGPVESLASEAFYSRAPLVIGSTAVKYRMAPTVEKSAHPTATVDLGAELIDRLQRDDVVFDFQVQEYVNATQTPIEDATVEWDAPFVTIAQVVISRGSEIDKTLDRQAFNPWNVASDDFTPIGSMNRARLRVYEASASLRAAGL